MKTMQRALLAAILVGAIGSSAGAATLSLIPGAITVAPGSIFSVDLVVAGLGDGGAPSLGDFDIDIGFDPVALSLVGFGLGSGLGDIGLAEAIDVSFGEFAPGLANIAEVSLLGDAALDAIQTESFVLATLDFMVLGLGPGESSIVGIVSVLALGDALGDPVPVDGTSPATVTVTAIPAPAALLLFACALAALRRRAPELIGVGPR